MICGSCGVRNVDFASTCFSCRQPLGKLGAVMAAPTPASDASGTRRSSARGATRHAGVRSHGGGLRLLLLAAVAWALVRGLPLRLASLLPRSADGPAESLQTVEPLPASEPASRESGSAVVEEQNGFRLVHFEWDAPAAAADGRFHTGETVSGRSEIQGFGVTADQKIDVTVALAFRDPTGNLVEPISPTTLRQPMESDTLYSRFDYAIPADAPGGEYDLEMAVDDAVSARSARFHRTIFVEAARSQ